MWNESMIRSFVSFGQTLSFTKTAQQMYITQQAVSKQIAKLEETLGCTLVRRERGGLSLTQEGMIYYQAFAKVLTIADEAAEEIRKLSEANRQTIRISYLPMFELPEVWYRFLKVFHARYPRVSIEYETINDEKVMDRLVEEEYDAAISFCDDEVLCGEMPELEYITLTEGGCKKICAHKDYPGAVEAQKDYRTLQDAKVFMSAHNRIQHSAILKQIGFSEKNAEYSGNLPSSLCAVNLLEGIMIIDDNTMIGNAQELLLIDLPVPSQPVCLIWKRAHITSQLRVMLQTLRKYKEKEGKDPG